MLNAVPTAINASARIVVLRHPNGMDCTVYTKSVNRVADDAPPDTIAGLPTLGGLGVLDSEDEADFSYSERGDARIVFDGTYQAAMGNWNRSDTGLTYAEGTIEALIEATANPTDPGYFICEMHDIVMVMPGNGFVLPYEVVDITGSVNIPPYVRKYHLTARADLAHGI